MNATLRAALVVALGLSLTLPAAASDITVTARGRLKQAPQQGNPPSARALFEKLHQHRRAKFAHFAFPYGLAVDGNGNLYVCNFDANDVSIVTSKYKVLSTTISQGVSAPISVAVDTNNNVYVANVAVNITKYNSSYALVGTITANGSTAESIAVDALQDIYIVSAYGGLSLDDPYGDSLYSNVFSGTLYSVAVGEPYVYTFYDNAAAFGNGSVALRYGELQEEGGPIDSAAAGGSACSSTISACWYGDSINNTLTYGLLPGNWFTVGLSYTPGGVAVDVARNRVYVADPSHNAIQIYNATTLAYEKTLT